MAQKTKYGCPFCHGQLVKVPAGYFKDEEGNFFEMDHAFYACNDCLRKFEEEDLGKHSEDGEPYEDCPQLEF